MPTFNYFRIFSISHKQTYSNNFCIPIRTKLYEFIVFLCNHKLSLGNFIEKYYHRHVPKQRRDLLFMVQRTYPNMWKHTRTFSEWIPFKFIFWFSQTVTEIADIKKKHQTSSGHKNQPSSSASTPPNFIYLREFMSKKGC